MPLIVSMLNTTRVQSMAISLVGMPSIAMRPPCDMLASIACKASPLPDISRPTSKPSVISSSRCTSARSLAPGSTVTVAPIRAASSRRLGLGSLTAT